MSGLDAPLANIEMLPSYGRPAGICCKGFGVCPALIVGNAVWI
mgnify:CR=1 FL=1|jgi:hypothetical protein